MKQDSKNSDKNFVKNLSIVVCNDILSTLITTEKNRFNSIISLFGFKDLLEFIQSCFFDINGNYTEQSRQTIYYKTLLEKGELLGDKNSENFKLFMRVQVIMALYKVKWVSLQQKPNKQHDTKRTICKSFDGGSSLVCT